MDDYRGLNLTEDKFEVTLPSPLYNPAMWPFKRKPLCTLYRSLAVITNADVYFAVTEALRDAELTVEADEFAAQWENLMDTTTGEEFAQAVKQLAGRYVRVKVVG